MLCTSSSYSIVSCSNRVYTVKDNDTKIVCLYASFQMNFYIYNRNISKDTGKTPEVRHYDKHTLYVRVDA